MYVYTPTTRTYVEQNCTDCVGFLSVLRRGRRGEGLEQDDHAGHVVAARSVVLRVERHAGIAELDVDDKGKVLHTLSNLSQFQKRPTNHYET